MPIPVSYTHLDVYKRQDLNEKKQILLDALEQAKEPMLSDRLVDYFNLRNEQRSDWSGKAKLKGTVRDLSLIHI